jgi:hypothetical protein
MNQSNRPVKPAVRPIERQSVPAGLTLIVHCANAAVRPALDIVPFRSAKVRP